MRVLFVGEGPNDVGTPDFAVQPRSAAGVVSALARRVCPEAIADDSASIFWRELPALPPKGKTSRGWTAKARSAVLLAFKSGCQATVCVADCDGEPDRLQAMQEGAEAGNRGVGEGQVTVCGLAVETIEAWTSVLPPPLRRSWKSSCRTCSADTR